MTGELTDGELVASIRFTFCLFTPSGAAALAGAVQRLSRPDLVGAARLACSSCFSCRPRRLSCLSCRFSHARTISAESNCSFSLSLTQLLAVARLAELR